VLKAYAAKPFLKNVPFETEGAVLEVQKKQKPLAAEINQNKRASSATLRLARKVNHGSSR
jgi:16S rRNA C1402 N4-methylase RsmH